MIEVKWDDQMRSRGRTPRLFFLRGGECHEFRVDPIPGIVAVLSDRYEKAGRWSHSSYVLAVASSATAVELCRPFEGWGTSWNSILSGVTVLAGPEPDRETLVSIIRGAANKDKWLAEAIAAADQNAAAVAELD